MKKEEYLIQQFKKKYPELFKQEEMSYILDTIDELNSQRHFKEFIERLNKM